MTESANTDNGDEEDGEGDDNYHYIDDYSANPDYGDVMVTKGIQNWAAQRAGERLCLTSIFRSFGITMQAAKESTLVTVQDKKKPWVQDRKLLVVSDIGMIVKKGEKNITVFCHSLVNAEKMRGVKVTFVSNNNQNIYTAETDGDGVATFAYDKTKYPGQRCGCSNCPQWRRFQFYVN